MWPIGMNRWRTCLPWYKIEGMGDYNQFVECFFCRRSIPLASARHPEDGTEWVCEDAEDCDGAINAAMRSKP